ncbi:hypothetical protein Cylst_2746 [Cylindrospermum stagnale PCC 7417]|uniref:Uncharacterized protein n=1 Tax=Cylindrospermum stagnale PCC 7417 TaxID=56107 RepID=K9WXK2_9NOST|nr:hypothetical protein Cylst_2746 [Cylindrospermum stagnale PCC 7417]
MSFLADWQDIFEKIIIMIGQYLPVKSSNKMLTWETMTYLPLTKSWEILANALSDYRQRNSLPDR